MSGSIDGMLLGVVVEGEGRGDALVFRRHGTGIDGRDRFTEQ